MIDLNAFLEEFEPGDESGPKRRKQISESDLKARLDYYEANTPGFEATDEHLRALMAIFNEHRHILLTGGAGTGKTTFIKSVVIPELNYRNLHWAVTATTGIAGSHLEGKTIHSFFGVGLGPNWPEVYPRRLKEYLENVVPGELVPPPQLMSPEELEGWYAMFYADWANDPKIRPHVRDGVIRRLRSHELLLIDEISMCNGNAMLGYLDYMLRQIRDDERAFGNLQMVFVGDFAQLPPVEKIAADVVSDWAFLSEAWDRARVKPIELTKVFRQGDQEFIRFLNNMRVGSMTQEDRDYIRRFVRNNMTQEETTYYTFLVPTNGQAKSINVAALDRYPGPTQPLVAEFQIDPRVQKMADWEIRKPEQVKEDLIKALDRRLLDKTTFVRIGYPVMFTVNDPDGRFVNGTRGFVREINISKRDPQNPVDTDHVVVGIPGRNPDDPERLVTLYRHAYSRNREQDPREMVDVPPAVNSMPDQPKLPAMFSYYPTAWQFPLIPAVAITIHKCVDKFTLVPTNEGMKRIGDICDGGKSMPSVAGILELKPASEPFVGVRELGYRVTTKRGYSEICSERHPLLRLGVREFEWTKAPNLRVGDVLRMRGGTMAFGDGALPSWDDRPPDYHASADYRIPAEMSAELAWLFGVLIGDGCVSDERDARMDVTSMDWCVSTKFADIMKSEFNLKATLKPKSTSKAKTSYVHSWGVRRWLKFLGLSHATAPTKRVPSVILSGSQTQQAAFLRGYFDSDGGVNTAVHVTSSSRELIGEVHLLLLNFGIVSTIAPMKKSWRINITGVDIVKFRDLIGFSIKRKQRLCEKLAPDHRKVIKAQSGFYSDDVGRTLALIIREELRSVYPGRKNGLHFGEHQPWAWFLSRVANGTCGVTDAHFAAMQRDLPLCKTAGPVSKRVFEEAEAGCFLDEIVSIERVEGDMRDICVEDGHAFVGNGFVNHNSQGMSLDAAILALSRTFAPGHVYVGLSRLRSPEGLVLTEENFTAKADPLVMEYYRWIKEENNAT